MLDVSDEDYTIQDNYVPTGDAVVDGLVAVVKMIAQRVMTAQDLYNLSKSVPSLWGGS